MQAGALVLTTGLMGLAGMPHCVAMCAAPCAAATRACGGGRGMSTAFHVGRLAGYAAAGAVAASSAGALQQWLGTVPALRPLWTLVQMAALTLGLCMLWRGRLPAWRPAALAPSTSSAQPVKWHAMRGATRSALVGGAWIAWPCALSQSALLVSLLSDRGWQGAAAMATFAIASSPGLVVGPLVLQRLSRRKGAAAAEVTWPVRAAGATVAAAALWALGHGLWERAAALCGLAP
jgi:sulfite exporter TauE/SafE